MIVVAGDKKLLGIIQKSHEMSKILCKPSLRTIHPRIVVAGVEVRGLPLSTYAERGGDVGPNAYTHYSL